VPQEYEQFLAGITRCRQGLALNREERDRSEHGKCARSPNGKNPCFA
jgi:hypothetical protein